MYCISVVELTVLIIISFRPSIYTYLPRGTLVVVQQLARELDDQSLNNSVQELERKSTVLPDRLSRLRSKAEKKPAVVNL